MSITFGPSSFWLRTKEAADYFAVRCPVGTALGDKSRIFCKTGGRAWIVAPFSTEVASSWAGGQYNTSIVGDKCCICEWSSACTALITNGFNPCDWFIPSVSQLQTASTCIVNWDYGASCYWTSTENCCCAWSIRVSTGVCGGGAPKTTGISVRAVRCVTY